MNVFSHYFYVGLPAYMDWLNEALHDYGERTMRNWVMFAFANHEVAMSLPLRSDCECASRLQAALLPSLRDVHMPWAEDATSERLSPAGRCAMTMADNVPMLLGRLYADSSTLIPHDFDEVDSFFTLTLASWRGMIAKARALLESGVGSAAHLERRCRGYRRRASRQPSTSSTW